MTAESTDSTECDREKLENALRDEALIEQLEAAIYSNEIWEKALDVVCKRIASGEVSENMLLRGRPRTGHDPMVGVRLPRKMLKKIAKVADALSADRSTAIRSILEAGLDSGRVIGLLLSGKGRGRTGEIAMGIMAQFKASKAAEHATRAAPAKRPQAEIKALRAAEDAVDRLSRIGDRLALKQAHKPSKSEATWIEPKPPAPSVEPIPKPTKLVVRKAHPRPLQKRKLSEAEVQEIVERAISRSQEKR